MNRADRLACLALLVWAAIAWTGLGWIFVTYDPRENAGVLLGGALLLGAAIALTLAPLFWLAAFVRHGRIAYEGDWWRAARRAALAGVVITMFVLLRGMGALSAALALFVVAMAVLVELTLSLRR